MKTEEQIVKEFQSTKEKILKELRLVNRNDVVGLFTTAKMHWENHIRLQGFRDALEWVLKEEK